MGEEEKKQKTHVRDLLTQQDFLVTLDTHRDNVLLVLKKLSSRHISSAPVFDGDRCIGFIDLLDILTYLLAVLTKPAEAKLSEVSISSLAENYEFVENLDTFESIKNDKIDEPEAVSLHTINEIVELSHRNPFVATMEDQPIFDVIIAFAKGLHRIPVSNKHDEIINIITQTTVARYLASHESKLGSVGNKTLEQLGFAFSNVLTVPVDTKAVVAFHKIHQNKSNAIAVVKSSSDLTLVGNLSTSDLKVLLKAHNSNEQSILNFDILFKPVSELLPLIASLNGQQRGFIATCTPASTILEIVKKMAELHLHNLYCIDSEGKVVGSVSISNICEIIVLHEPKCNLDI